MVEESNPRRFRRLSFQSTAHSHAGIPPKTKPHRGAFLLVRRNRSTGKYEPRCGLCDQTGSSDVASIPSQTMPRSFRSRRNCHRTFRGSFLAGAAWERRKDAVFRVVTAENWLHVVLQVNDNPRLSGVSAHGLHPHRWNLIVWLRRLTLVLPDKSPSGVGTGA